MKILFIVEKNLIQGNAYFGSSNDLLLIFEGLKQGKEVYIITPDEFFKSQNNKINFEINATKLEKIDLKKVEKIYQEFLYKEAINALTALPSNPTLEEKNKSKILFKSAKKTKINLKEVVVFNRTEPVSLDDKFYDCLINLKNSDVFITPNPELTKILGDKKSVYGIHHNKPISGINLAEELSKKDLNQKKNKISFDSLIIKISTEKLSTKEVLEFYKKLEISHSKEVFKDKEFTSEFKIFYEGAKKYADFHKKLNNDSVVKPASYFGGTGVVPAKETKLDISKAIKNICKMFYAIREDCQKGGYENMALLPEIIIQKRATEAHLGDLRIMICAGKLHGIIVRVNPSFEKSGASNMHHGGHPETLFGKYPISKNGIDKMILDMKKSGLSDQNLEIKKAKALYGLLESIEIIKKINSFKQYAIIGADALLTKMKDGNYRYGINEINLTSPMGQVQLMAIHIGVKNSKFSEKILIRKEILKAGQIKPYQVLSDYCKNLTDKKAKELQNMLLQNQELEARIKQDVAKMLTRNNPATQTLEVLCRK